MWYFTWIIGVGFAVAVGIINVLWLEANERMKDRPDDMID